MKKNKFCVESGDFLPTKKFLLVAKIASFLILVAFMQVSASNNSSANNSTLVDAFQQDQVSGKVTDSNGEELPGVTVVLAGTTNGTITDIDGNYTLSNVPSDGTLQFSFVGMKSQEVAINGRTSINITLEEETIGLEEVVAIGYGTTTRKNFTGSVSKVTLEDSPEGLGSSTNVMGLIRGITPGMTVTQTTNAGDSPDIQIRGQKSIAGNTPQERRRAAEAAMPLLVVDGVIFSGQLNDIDPENIASVQVLKDATSLAAYGSKASSGVLMITLKKGKRGKPSFSFKTSATVTVPGLKPDVRDADGYIELMSYRSSGGPNADLQSWMAPLEYENYLAGKKTDWVDYIDRTGVLQNYTLSFSGATENTNYYLSGSVLDQKGNYYGDNYGRSTFNANLTSKINQYLEINANTMFSYNRNWGVRPNYGVAAAMSPYYSPTLADGVTMRDYVDNREATNTNPLWDTFNGREDETKTYTNVYGGFINLRIPHVEGLSYRITGSYTIRSSERNEFRHETNFPLFIGTGGDGADGQTTEAYDTQLINATGTVTSRKNISWDVDNILTYTRQFNDHFVNATLVYTRTSSKNIYREVTGSDYRGLGNTTLGIYDLPNAGSQIIDSYTYSLHNDVGYLARMIYSFKETYHLDMSLRRDGSSVFGAGKKWGTFPAIGGAWTVTNERFMSGLKGTINNLKLKLSWGSNGRQALDPYQTLSTLNMGVNGGLLYFFGDNPYYGQNIDRLGNPQLGWEATEAFNYGFEGDFVKTLHVEVNAYKSKTTNQIFSRIVPIMGSGISEQDATLGRVDNWGIEATISNLNINKGDFSWQTSLLFSLNRNKLVELYGNGEDDIPNGYFLGKSLGAIYGYVLDGVVNAGEESYLSNVSSQLGDAQYKDISGPNGVPDGEITPEYDRTILGYNKPSFTLNMTNTINYKNFSLYFLFTGIFSGGDYGLAANNESFLSAFSFFYRNTLNHPFWTADNKSETYPRYDYTDSRYTHLQPYGHVRLQNVNLSYNFNNELLSRYGITGLQLFATASNLFVIAPKWDFTDPDTRSYTQAQIPRTFQFGLNLKF